jgi:hypothetical protein
MDSGSPSWGVKRGLAALAAAMLALAVFALLALGLLTADRRETPPAGAGSIHLATLEGPCPAHRLDLRRHARPRGDQRKWEASKGRGSGGAGRIRTGGQAFAELCLATWPRRRRKLVPRVRLELTRPNGHCPLKTACLPFHHLGTAVHASDADNLGQARRGSELRTSPGGLMLAGAAGLEPATGGFGGHCSTS